MAETLDRYSLLLDTYDVDRAIETAVDVAQGDATARDTQLAAVRLDCGDLLADSSHVRAGWTPPA